MRRRSAHLFLALAALGIFGPLALPSMAAAEVQRIELDIAGYLCGR